MRLFQVDAFTKNQFSGNPAAVCILDKHLNDNILQNIAAEMNLSETAFVQKSGNSFNLRWFTPKVEVDLCGHATLATAHILYEEKIVPIDKEITFNTKSGNLFINKEETKIVMNFPQKHVKKIMCPENIKKAFDIKPLDSYFDNEIYLIEIDSDCKLKKLKPDYTALKKEKFEFIITARSTDSNYDFISRFFAPCIGIDEDPVTGSAHSYLAPYWGKKLNKTKLIGFQASERTGIVECELLQNDRLLLKGEAVTIFKGEFEEK
ncbi:MAG: PhzF family phenazine biosynthesis protein [Candidatus Marinimicrobia bacterium]|nr:PhzF family phenazine biosynthesis protein [Candidatus Neomarinimicrobiota bacterium]